MMISMPNALLVLQEAEGGGGLLTVDGGLVIWTLVVFGILLFVLRRSVWPVLLAAVRDREAALARQIAEAEKNRAESAALLEQHRQLLAKAQADAQDLIAKAKVVSQKEREALVAKGHEEQEALLARARREIEAEKDKAIQALRKEAVDLSIAAASKLLETNLDSDTNRRLVMDYLASLEQKH